MKKTFLFVAILSLAMISTTGCVKKEEPQNIPLVQTQTTEKKQIAQEEPQKQQPNALDYMAPGYRQAQDKIKQVQDLRQQAIDENNYNPENMNY